MGVNATHAEYDANLPAWLRARDVVAGEDNVKAAGAKYLPRLETQSDAEFDAYRARAAFFNATARTADGYVGLVFRRPPFIKVPGDETTNHTNDTKAAAESPSPQPSPPKGRGSSTLGRAMAEFVHDADMRGTSLASYAKGIVSEIIAVGRVGSLVDWEGESENRVYVSRYTAENILNWRVERVNGRNVVTMVVLAEEAEVSSPLQSVSDPTTLTRPSGALTRPCGPPSPIGWARGFSRARGRGTGGEGDEFAPEVVEQIRVLRLIPEVSGGAPETTRGARVVPMQYIVDLWQLGPAKSKEENAEWTLVETRVPLRLGKPLPLIPFVFHGPRHSLPDVDKMPLGDVMAVNLDHYRLDADFKHGMHFTALPTAWVSGFDKEATLRIGSSTAWVTDTVGAAAGFLEYTGQGLKTFERALDRDERLMAVLGARLLESQKKVGETADAIELRQSGENSILGNLALSVSASLTQVLAWAYWWNSTEEQPDQVSTDQVVMELNTDFSMKGMSAQELTSVVAAWQSGALSRDSMLDLFRRGEILPEGRTNEEETKLVQQDEVKRIRTVAAVPGGGGQMPAAVGATGAA